MENNSILPELPNPIAPPFAGVVESLWPPSKGGGTAGIPRIRVKIFPQLRPQPNRAAHSSPGPRSTIVKVAWKIPGAVWKVALSRGRNSADWWSNLILFHPISAIFGKWILKQVASGKLDRKLWDSNLVSFQLRGTIWNSTKPTANICQWQEWSRIAVTWFTCFPVGCFTPVMAILCHTKGLAILLVSCLSSRAVKTCRGASRMIESHIPCDSGHFGEWLAAMGFPADRKLSSEGLLLEPTT